MPSRTQTPRLRSGRNRMRGGYQRCIDAENVTTVSPVEGWSFVEHLGADERDSAGFSRVCLLGTGGIARDRGTRWSEFK